MQIVRVVAICLLCHVPCVSGVRAESPSHPKADVEKSIDYENFLRKSQQERLGLLKEMTDNQLVDLLYAIDSSREMGEMGDQIFEEAMTAEIDLGSVILDELQRSIVSGELGVDLRGISMAHRSFTWWVLATGCKGVDLDRARRLRGALGKKGERLGDITYLKHAGQLNLAIRLCRKHY
jgi:hypothetical protein